MSGEQLSAESAQRGHLLSVSKSKHWTADDPDWTWVITCLAPEKCGGWQECDESHEIEGQPVNDGPWDSDESAPWCEQDQYVFHGVEHEYRWGHGWTVPFDGCVVAEHAYWSDSVAEIVDEHGEGEHVVDDDWDDEVMTMIYVEPLRTPPAAGGQ